MITMVIYHLQIREEYDIRVRAASASCVRDLVLKKSDEVTCLDGEHGGGKG